MIPVKLSLRNFLSYGEDVRPLDFSGFHVACLSGENGHGKSALLDAMTWSLWGQARKSRSRGANEGLLKIGASEMRVEFEFDLEEQRFRVIRSFRRGKGSGRPSLEFQVYDNDKGKYRVLSDVSSMRRTQEEIDDALKMDYDTFINSAFILQGRADEFTRKTPTERKQILADILGLSKYDLLWELSRSHYNKLDNEIEGYCRESQRIDEELSHKDLYKEQIDGLTVRLSELSRGIESLEKVFSELREKKGDLERKREQVEDLESELDRIQDEIDDIKGQIDSSSDQISEYEKIICKEDEIKSDISTYNRLMDQEREFTQRLGRLRDLESRKADVDRKVEEAKHEVEKCRNLWEERLGSAENVLDEAKEILKREKEIASGYKELMKSRRENEKMEGLRRSQDELLKAELEIQRKIEKLKSGLEVELGTLRNQITELDSKADAQEHLKGRLEKIRQELERLEVLESESENIRDKGSELNVKIDGDIKGVQDLEKEIAEENDKLDLIKESQDSSCPLCESHIDEEKRENIVRKMEEKIEKVKAEIAVIQGELEEDEKERSELRRKYREAKEVLESLPSIRSGAAQAEALFNEAVEAGGKIAELKEDEEAVRRRLDERDFAPEEREDLEKVKRQIEKLGYNTQKHEEIGETLQKLKGYEAEKARLDSTLERYNAAKEAIPGIKEEIRTAKLYLDEKKYAEKEQKEVERVLDEIQKVEYDKREHEKIRLELDSLSQAPVQAERLRDARDKIDAVKEVLKILEKRFEDRMKRQDETKGNVKGLKVEIAGTVDVEQKISGIEKTLRDSRVNREKLLGEQGSAQARYDKCLELEEEKKEVTESLRKAQEERDIYDKLRRAFGKDGIQALIIENAIPEIEDEANDILSRLTDNKTHISIESQRGLKSGGLRETLDIKISDELGERDYELYSGGEAFRTNFALRIALSKLLARRAGTKLRTLVIDEGFGTQDSEGLGHLVGAIDKISKDFDKILVVTHLEELKRAFPVRIEVRKNARSGSEFEIVT